MHISRRSIYGVGGFLGPVWVFGYTMYFLDMIECDNQHVDLLSSGGDLSRSIKMQLIAVGNEKSL